MKRRKIQLPLVGVLLAALLLSTTAQAQAQGYPNPEFLTMLSGIGETDANAFAARQTVIHQYLAIPGKNTEANQIAYFNALNAVDMREKSMWTDYAGVRSFPTGPAAIAAGSIKPLGPEAAQAQMRVLDHMLMTHGPAPQLHAVAMMDQMTKHLRPEVREAFLQKLASLEATAASGQVRWQPTLDLIKKVRAEVGSHVHPSEIVKALPHTGAGPDPEFVRLLRGVDIPTLEQFSSRQGPIEQYLKTHPDNREANQTAYFEALGKADMSATSEVFGRRLGDYPQGYVARAVGAIAPAGPKSQKAQLEIVDKLLGSAKPFSHLKEIPSRLASALARDQMAAAVAMDEIANHLPSSEMPEFMARVTELERLSQGRWTLKPTLDMLKSIRSKIGRKTTLSSAVALVGTSLGLGALANNDVQAATVSDLMQKVKRPTAEGKSQPEQTSSSSRLQ